jgi:hypothetical protein
VILSHTKNLSQRARSRNTISLRVARNLCRGGDCNRGAAGAHRILCLQDSSVQPSFCERTFGKSLTNEAVSFVKADRIDSSVCLNFGGVVQTTLVCTRAPVVG